jgi:hypothetical protein
MDPVKENNATEQKMNKSDQVEKMLIELIASKLVMV